MCVPGEGCVEMPLGLREFPEAGVTARVSAGLAGGIRRALGCELIRPAQKWPQGDAVTASAGRVGACAHLVPGRTRRVGAGAGSAADV